MEHAIGLLLLCIAGSVTDCDPAIEASMRVPELRIYIDMVRESPELYNRLTPEAIKYIHQLGEP